jgi:hypothetical protein
VLYMNLKKQIIFGVHTVDSYPWCTMRSFLVGQGFHVFQVFVPLMPWSQSMTTALDLCPMSWSLINITKLDLISTWHDRQMDIVREAQWDNQTIIIHKTSSTLSTGTSSTL